MITWKSYGSFPSRQKNSQRDVADESAEDIFLNDQLVCERLRSNCSIVYPLTDIYAT